MKETFMDGSIDESEERDEEEDDGKDRPKPTEVEKLAETKKGKKSASLRTKKPLVYTKPTIEKSIAKQALKRLD